MDLNQQSNNFSQQNNNFSVNNQNFNQPLQSATPFSLSQVQPQQVAQPNQNPQSQYPIQTPTILDSGKNNVTNPTQKTEVKKPNPNSTQNYLQIAEIREGLLIMKDGSFKAVVGCKSINFDLMSAREKEGIEYGYQGFLNSLYFPIQILVRSNKVDIGPYLEKLVDIRSKQDNMLLNVLIDDYINYIQVLSQEANIMDKSFYIIIPYYPTTESFNDIKAHSKGLFSNLFSNKNVQTVRVNQRVYTAAKEEIQNRVDVISSGLSQVGVKSAQLNTEQLSQLFYNFYNPDISSREPLVNFNNVSTIYTSKGNNQTGSEL